MAATGKFIHASTHTGLAINMTNAYVVGQRHLLPLYADSTGTVGNRGVGRLSALYIHVNTIAAGAFFRFLCATTCVLTFLIVIWC